MHVLFFVFISTDFLILILCVIWDMDRRSPGDRQADTSKTVTTASSSSVVTMATPSSSAQPPSTSLSILPPDRQAVIQHAMNRPQSMAAQYLHQMYAAQQQHFMLQTAALQQHQHPAHLQSLAAIQQVGWSLSMCCVSV
uniref:Polyhomeotic-like protein 3 n=1 Tax=Neolamprologus brichardi TaxID=32507 RepID=A0A3Q4MN24_NEOBR